jgi:hypothetical protein
VPANAPPSLPGHPPRCPPRRELTNRTDSPAGSSPRSVGWLRPWRSSLDRSCWPPDAPAAEPGSGTQPDHRLGHALDGAALPTGSPITLAGDGLVAYLAGGRGMASVRCSGRAGRTHPFVPDGRRRPGETPVRTPLSPRYLIRMRAEVQVLPGPLPVTTSGNASYSKVRSRFGVMYRMTPHNWHNFLRCHEQAAEWRHPVAMASSKPLRDERGPPIRGPPFSVP